MKIYGSGDPGPDLSDAIASATRTPPPVRIDCVGGGVVEDGLHSAWHGLEAARRGLVEFGDGLLPCDRHHLASILDRLLADVQEVHGLLTASSGVDMVEWEREMLRRRLAVPVCSGSPAS
jgi:hypothetical protein